MTVSRIGHCLCGSWASWFVSRPINYIIYRYLFII